MIGSQCPRLTWSLLTPTHPANTSVVWPSAVFGMSLSMWSCTDPDSAAVVSTSLSRRRPTDLLIHRSAMVGNSLSSSSLVAAFRLIPLGDWKVRHTLSNVSSPVSHIRAALSIALT